MSPADRYERLKRKALPERAERLVSGGVEGRPREATSGAGLGHRVRLRDGRQLGAFRAGAGRQLCRAVGHVALILHSTKKRFGSNTRQSVLFLVRYQ